ncbi:MAG TPA: MFS transporter [Methanoregula sp.]|nr:MFS transporter [Methanoregula sp.]
MDPDDTGRTLDALTVDVRALDRKIWWRIIPFAIILYVISILDRVNIGFAALTMNADLGIDPYLFGIISGVFFISYIIFQVPSSQLLAKTGARFWLFLIMASWGFITMLMSLAQTPLELGILRFLLGAAEAGFAPGLILYLSFWFRRDGITRAMAVFFTAIPLAMVIASPVSALILSQATWIGIAGWRWLFVLEGLPAIIFGVLILIVLPDLPEKASWLTREERTWLTARLEGSQVCAETRVSLPLRELAATPRLPLLCASSFLVGLFLTSLLFWIPQIIQNSGMTRSFSDTALLVMLPYGISVIAMYGWSRHSDRQGERLRHVAVPAAVAAFFLVMLSVSPGIVTGFFMLSGAIIACYMAYAPFSVLTIETFPPALRACGVALVNTVASVGSFLGPVLFGLGGGQLGSPLTTALGLALGVALAGCAFFFIRSGDTNGRKT